MKIVYKRKGTKRSIVKTYLYTSIYKKVSLVGTSCVVLCCSIWLEYIR
jgi:hypothetical protein